MQTYEYVNDHGPIPARTHGKSARFSGQTLIDMAQENYSKPSTLLESKQIMRQLISHYLGEQPLHTRQLIKDLREIL
jgi:DNA repair protein RecO (recombination protein O)